MFAELDAGGFDGEGQGGAEVAGVETVFG